MGSWGEQYSCGDQSKIQRYLFWDKDYRVCPICKSININEKKDCAGCRHNGDGYGTALYDCKDCGWSTSFLYDESDCPYYYETRKWKMSDLDVVYVPPPDKVIGAYIRERKYEPLYHEKSREELRTIMLADGYSDKIIDEFIASHVKKRTVTERVTHAFLRRGSGAK